MEKDYLYLVAPFIPQRKKMQYEKTKKVHTMVILMHEKKQISVIWKSSVKSK